MIDSQLQRLHEHVAMTTHHCRRASVATVSVLNNCPVHGTGTTRVHVS